MPRVDVTLPEAGITGWVEFTHMTIDDLEAYADAEDKPAGVIKAVKHGATSYEFSNGLSIGEQPREMLNVLIRAWNRTEDEDALPPVNGQPSESPS